MLNVQVVAFATMGPYLAEAKKLLDSADEFGIKVDISTLPQPVSYLAEWSDWSDVVSYKPRFILKMLDKHKDRDGILYTDADSKFARYAEFSVFEKAHIGFHTFKRSKAHPTEFLTGTMYFAVTPTVRKFVEDWASITPTYRKKFTPEQDSLKECMKRWGGAISYVDPGPEWCWIHDDFPNIYGQRTPVVVHFQASRRMRGSASR